MNIENHYRCMVDVRKATDDHGYERATLMLKATYALPKPGDTVRIADDLVPWFYSDMPVDETGLGGVAYEADISYEKLHPEFLVVGTAHAPEGKPTERFPFAVSVGKQTKSMVATGARTWQSGLVSGKASAIEPIVSLPASYTKGFGGADPGKVESDPDRWCETNLAGTGYCDNPASRKADGLRLPQLEPMTARFREPCRQFASLGMGPVARNWMPRAPLAGTYDDVWRTTRWPRLPHDFDPLYFQSAAQDQWLTELVSGQPVALLNMTAASSLFGSELRFNLPALDYFAAVHPRRGKSTRLQLRPDTLILEPDAGRFSIIARTQYPLNEGLHELKAVVFGDPVRPLERGQPTTILLPDFIKQLRSSRPSGPGETKAL
ncbi:DUF2169 family type VI secretion system accessory protein [Acidovorax sp. LjRoot117]|uniref:DUF2169 family type VI secretion system accessory protein n=1 Tax=Acidovorax sp. LjRoot117 TaxID=3342255 RepID=UPI003ECF3DCE